MLRYEVVNAVKFNNLLYKLLGAVILILNKIRHELQGYRTPRTFSIEKYEKGTNYDIEVVNGWVNCLQEYCDGNFLIGNKCVLELGPGADLGVGLYLLFSGASKYNALDVNNLVGQCPTQFYDFFFKKLILLEPNAETKIKNLRAQLQLTRQGKNDRLNYVCSEDFDLNVFEKKTIDLVVSQAAFEHFDNVGRTFNQLDDITKTGAILISEIDLSTHTRWIRDKDSLNIYRYGDCLYDLCKFKGAPNRVRPYKYKELLQKSGWCNIKIIPKRVIDELYFSNVRYSLNKRFHGDINQMEQLSVFLCATKK